MTNRNHQLILSAGLVLSLSALSDAHHGAAGLFDETQTVEVTGAVKMWSFVNPHPVLLLDVVDGDDQHAEWDIYFGPAAAAALRRRGYAGDTFTVGETVTVVGHPAMEEGIRGLDVFGQASRITRGDGRRVP